MKFNKLIILRISFFVFWECTEENDEIMCTNEFVFGIQVQLIDASTSNFITENVQVVIKDKNYEETLNFIDSDSLFYGAGERSGTYTIKVTSDNYKTFISNPIVVTSDICHVKSVLKKIELSSNI